VYGVPTVPLRKTELPAGEPSGMYVVVGSANPVKRRAVESVVGAEWDVEARGVPSGVAEQPRGHVETREGARNRAEAAFDAVAGETSRRTLGVGIEGGVARFEECTTPFLVNWAAATDGDRVTCATGPSFPLPEHVARRVADGEELGPVMDDELGQSDVKKKQGAAGVFTAGMVDREASLSTGVAAALGPFVSEQY
jgi:inosine/xanthosine triphosphatase